MFNFILPTLNRTKKLLNCLDSIAETTQDYYEDVNIILVTQDFESTQKIQEGVSDERFGKIKFKVVSKVVSAIEGWNIGLQASSRGEKNWNILTADDLIFYPKWWQNALSTLNYGFIGLNDMSGHYEGNASHYMMTDQFIRMHNGGVLVIPCYQTWYTDVETCERAKIAGKYVYAVTSLVEHNHPDWGKSSLDDTYKLRISKREEDRLLYEERKKQGFPNDFKNII